MKKIFILCLGIGLLFSYRGFGQVGEKVFSVNILNMNNDTVALPMLGQKNLPRAGKGPQDRRTGS